LSPEAEDPAKAAEFRSAEAALIAAEVEMRRGKQLSAQSQHLPRDLRPRGLARQFVVTSDDVVTLKP
jgi:hypothetical protein